MEFFTAALNAVDLIRRPALDRAGADAMPRDTFHIDSTGMKREGKRIEGIKWERFPKWESRICQCAADTPVRCLLTFF
jgi:hypothetical protein